FARDVGVALALQALLEFVGAVSRVDQVRVAIDEAGRDPRTACVVSDGCLAVPVAARADPGDAPLPCGDRAIADRAIRRFPFAQRREIRVQPAGAASGHCGWTIQYSSRQPSVPM